MKATRPQAPQAPTALRRKLDADKITVVGMDGGHALAIQPLTTRGHAVGEYRPIPAVSEQTIRHAQERDQARRRAFRRMLGPREDLATLMLGTASVALAMVMSIVTLMGLRGISFPPWSVPRDVMVKASPPRFTDVYDPVSRRYAAVPKLVSSGKVFVPSSVCCGLAFLGLVLGGIGLAVSLRRRKLSWLSAIGFTLMLLMMAIVIACDTLMTLSP